MEIANESVVGCVAMKHTVEFLVKFCKNYLESIEQIPKNMP